MVKKKLTQSIDEDRLSKAKQDEIKLSSFLEIRLTTCRKYCDINYWKDITEFKKVQSTRRDIPILQNMLQ
jgi:hypothetical protein